MSVPHEYILGIDTSCDETSVAIYDAGAQRVLANVISSQIAQHAPFGGVVPELASRQHIENLFPVLEQALEQAKLKLPQMAALAVTVNPGLMGCLLVGVSFAKALAYRLQVPLYAINHLEAHLFSPYIGERPEFPFLGLVVSGGHTAFYEVRDFDQVRILGQTVDDAVGELYDKSAKMMGLGYPGGPLVDRLAQAGDDSRFKFALPRVKFGQQYLSFSGLKTAVSHTLRDLESRDEKTLRDLCASLQKTVVRTLIDKAGYFLREADFKALALSGGVAMNSLLRLQTADFCRQQGLKVKLASPEYCTDNAAMVAYLAQFKKPVKNLDEVQTQASVKLQARQMARRYKTFQTRP